jgi:hypothetical protein
LLEHTLADDLHARRRYSASSRAKNNFLLLHTLSSLPLTIMAKGKTTASAAACDCLPPILEHLLCAPHIMIDVFNVWFVLFCAVGVAWGTKMQPIEK